MAAVAALARLAITLGCPLKYLAAAAGVLVAITVAGREKRRMVGDGDGLGLEGGGVIKSQFYLQLHHDNYAFAPRAFAPLLTTHGAAETPCVPSAEIDLCNERAREDHQLTDRVPSAN